MNSIQLGNESSKTITIEFNDEKVNVTVKESLLKKSVLKEYIPEQGKLYFKTNDIFCLLDGDEEYVFLKPDVDNYVLRIPSDSSVGACPQLKTDRKKRLQAMVQNLWKNKDGKDNKNKIPENKICNKKQDLKLPNENKKEKILTRMIQLGWKHQKNLSTDYEFMGTRIGPKKKIYLNGFEDYSLEKLKSIFMKEYVNEDNESYFTNSEVNIGVNKGVLDNLVYDGKEYPFWEFVKISGARTSNHVLNMYLLTKKSVKTPTTDELLKYPSCSSLQKKNPTIVSLQQQHTDKKDNDNSNLHKYKTTLLNEEASCEKALEDAKHEKVVLQDKKKTDLYKATNVIGLDFKNSTKKVSTYSQTSECGTVRPCIEQQDCDIKDKENCNSQKWKNSFSNQISSCDKPLQDVIHEKAVVQNNNIDMNKKTNVIPLDNKNDSKNDSQNDFTYNSNKGSTDSQTAECTSVENKNHSDEETKNNKSIHSQLTECRNAKRSIETDSEIESSSTMSEFKKPRSTRTYHKLDISIKLIKENEITFSNVILGRGGQGIVTKGKYCGSPVAIKSIQKGEDDKLILREILLLDKIRHPNIISIMAACCTFTQFHIIMEYFNGDSLFNILFKEEVKKKYAWNFTLKCNIALQIARALTFLHLQPVPILHRDVKPCNVLVDSRNNVKICDLGLGKCKSINPSLQTTRDNVLRGTYLFMAPELILRQEPATTKSDVWAYACTLSELFDEKPIWDSAQYFSGWDCVKEHLHKGDVPSMELIPFFCKEKILQCFNYAPNSRPDMMEILEVFEKWYNIH